MAISEAPPETVEAVRAQIAVEREQLAAAVETMREANLGEQLRAKLPLLAVGAFGAAFILAGGVGATVRLIFRRGREGRERTRVGHFALIDRR